MLLLLTLPSLKKYVDRRVRYVFFHTLFDFVLSKVTVDSIRFIAKAYFRGAYFLCAWQLKKRL